MPAFATHYLFFRDMMPFIEGKAQFQMHTSVMALGAQGPDMFFFSRLLPITMPGKPQAKIGVKLHNAIPGDIFDAFRDYCQQSDNIDVAKSYIYGFITHYALDRTCHPYVYSFQENIIAEGKITNPSSAHNTIELSMDSCMIKRKLGYDIPYDFIASETIQLTDSEAAEVAKLLTYVINRVTDCEIVEDNILIAIKDIARFQNILNDKSGRFVVFCRAMETIFAPVMKHYKLSSNIKPRDVEKAKMYANTAHKTWHSPFMPEVERNESFFELYDSARQDSALLITGFEDMLANGTSGKNITNNISFLTGIEAQ